MWITSIQILDEAAGHSSRKWAMAPPELWEPSENLLDWLADDIARHPGSSRYAWNSLDALFELLAWRQSCTVRQVTLADISQVHQVLTRPMSSNVIGFGACNRTFLAWRVVLLDTGWMYFLRGAPFNA